MVFNQNENSEVIWIISIDELGVEMEFVRKIREGTQMTTHQMQVKVFDNKVERWWPNGAGQQKIYDIKVAMLRGKGRSTFIFRVKERIEL